MSASSSAVIAASGRRHGYFNLKRTFNPIIDKWLMDNGLDYAVFYPSFLNWVHRIVTRATTNPNITATAGEKMVLINVYEYNLSDEAPLKYVEALDYYRRERWGGHDRPATGIVKNFGSDEEIQRAEDELLEKLIAKHKVDHPEMWHGDRGLMMPPKKKVRRAAVQAQAQAQVDNHEMMTMGETESGNGGNGDEIHGEMALDASNDEGNKDDDGDTKMDVESDDDYNPPEPVSPWWT